MPTVSVVLPVYNGAEFIADSIESILTQSLKDFELIVVDDGSTDSTPSIIESFSDTRIVYCKLPRNMGSAAATNFGHATARGKYVAHMDADDIAVANRLERQVAFLERYPKIAILGGCMQTFGATSDRAGVPADDAQIKAAFLSGAGNIYNPTAMIRRSFLEGSHLRCNPSLKGAFDWGLWVEAMFLGAKFANLPDDVLRYRIHERQQSRDQSDIRPELAKIRLRILDVFYPALTHDERSKMEPLLQWAGPPSLRIDEIKSGLRGIERARLYSKQSRLGEDRQSLKQYLQQCHGRWSRALAAHDAAL